MAVDTAAERLSLFSFGRAGGTLPLPDGSIGLGDYAILLGLFAGYGESPPDITTDAVRRLALIAFSRSCRPIPWPDATLNWSDRAMMLALLASTEISVPSITSLVLLSVKVDTVMNLTCEVS